MARAGDGEARCEVAVVIVVQRQGALDDGRTAAADFQQNALAGGLAYTLGAAVFLLDSRIRYAHFIWHLFVLAGSGCHVVAALLPID